LKAESPFSDHAIDPKFEFVCLQMTHTAILRSDNDKIKIAFTKLTNIVTRKTSTQFTFKMKVFTSNKCSFNFIINKQKASADAPKPTKNDTIQLETNVFDIEKATIQLKLLSNTSKLPNLIDPMYHESFEMHVINDIQNLNVPDTTHTTGLVLEVSAAIKLSSDDNCQTIMLNKVLIDTGCTKTIIKSNILPDQFFESQKRSKEVTWTTHAGKFVTKYEIPLQFSLPEFAPSREIG
jgi:hypothetical protein